MRRYCEISCHVLVGTAFFALAMTGRLDLLSMAVFPPVWAVSFYRTIRGLPPGLTTRNAFYLSCAYVILMFLDLTVYSRSLIGTAVHMVLFLELVKLHQEKSEKDYLYLVILAFLKILAASSLTVDISFVGTLLLFLIALVSTLMSHDIYRSEQKVTNQRSRGCGCSGQHEPLDHARDHRDRRRAVLPHSSRRDGILHARLSAPASAFRFLGYRRTRSDWKSQAELGRGHARAARHGNTVRGAEVARSCSG